MRPLLTLLAFTTLAVAGCTDAAGPADGVYVRLRNDSPLRFDQTAIYLSEGPHQLGPLRPHEESDYVEAGTAYRFMTSYAVVGADTLWLQVIDYFGEEPLVPGRYTYALTVYDDGHGIARLDQTIEED